MSHEQVENHPLHRARTCMSELGAPHSQQEEGRTERTRNFREILLGYAKFKITCAKQMCMNKTYKSIEQLYDDEDRFVPNVVASANALKHWIRGIKSACDVRNMSDCLRKCCKCVATTRHLIVIYMRGTPRRRAYSLARPPPSLLPCSFSCSSVPA